MSPLSPIAEGTPLLPARIGSSQRQQSRCGQDKIHAQDDHQSSRCNSRYCSELLSGNYTSSEIMYGEKRTVRSVVQKI